MNRTAAVLLLWALTASVASAQPDLFGRLGLKADATDKEVKKAYRSMVKTLHPDAVAPDKREKATVRFREVTEAYEILLDPKKRAQWETGRRPQTSADDRMYLKHNLFQEFDGVQLKDQTVQALISNSKRDAHIVYFWSSNYPDCIDFAPPFKQLATKLRGTSVTVASYKCDEDPMICRRLGMMDLPSVKMFPATGPIIDFTGKIELVALTTFAARFLKVGNVIRESSADAILNVTPNAYPQLQRYGLAGNYLWATTKKSHKGEIDFGLVTLEYGPCFDCDTSLQLAIETVAAVLPEFNVRRVNCKKKANAELCTPHRVKDRAWSMLLVKKRCWYATKKPFRFTDEHCDPLDTRVFEGKYTNDALVNFIVGGLAKTESKRFGPSRWEKVKKGADAWAVFFDDGSADATSRSQWELLARSVNRIEPMHSRKGIRLHVGTADCKAHRNFCDSFKQQLPFAAVFGYGEKVKNTPPVVYSKIPGWKALRKDLERDAEPLHLHILNPKNYDKKINEGIKKGKTWFVLYNAGQWCPPCNSIREPWKEAVRIVQNSDKSKKLGLATIECDQHKQLCNSLGIDNYPAMMLLSKGRPKVEYSGMRDGHELAKWALDQIDNRLVSMHPGDLQNRVQRGETVLACFSAGQWCPPCNQIASVIKAVANTLTKSLVTSINCDEYGMFCNNFNIDGYPTVVLFTRGKRHVYEGRKDAGAITTWAQQFL
jgi:thioredoxin-like negative regulator of GroEL